MQIHCKSPVSDSVLQVVVNSRTILGRTILAAEEAAVVLLVLAPALQAFTLVLLSYSNCVDELNVRIPATKHRCSSGPSYCLHDYEGPCLCRASVAQPPK